MNPETASAGILHVWIQGDAVTRAVAILLLLMSLTTWTIIGLKVLSQRAHRRQAAQCESFWHSGDFAVAVDKLGPHELNPFRDLALQGREATRHILHQDGASVPQLHDKLNLSDWVERTLRNSVDDFTARAQGGLTVLASIASTAPFVGLFGTVWGIYHALIGIGQAGQVGIDQVAGPVGEALIMTAMGLAVAIPAVLGYNVLVRGNKFVMHRLNRFANDLLAYFVTGGRVTAAAGEARVLPMKKA